MHVMRYIVGSFILMLAGTALGVVFYPDVNFIQYVGKTLTGASLVLLGVWFILMFFKGEELTERGKHVFMWALLIIILVPTTFTAGAWIHQSQTSWSGGEVHWHADFEIVVQDDTGDYAQLDLVNPEEFCQRGEGGGYMCKLNDRTGATEYHEHDDRRIHLEGVFREREEATLSEFFETFDGRLTNEELVFPTSEGDVVTLTEDGKSLKILVEKGVGTNRYWCVIGDEATPENVCISNDNEQKTFSPSDYVISPFQTGPIDIIWVIYDDASTEEALEDLREDGMYKEFDLTKTAGSVE